MKYIVMISGGKDSVAMLDLLLKNKYKVDYIIFNDTLLEFDEMYEYIDKVKKYIKDNYNKEIITLKPNKNPFDEMKRKVYRKSSKNYGKILGVFSINQGFCQWRTYAKQLPLDRFLRHNKIKEYKLYIGFTLDEINRKNKIKNSNYLFPLIDDFKMTENDCLEYTKQIGLYNPLYDYFDRLGCRICPAMSKDKKRIIYEKFPKVWNEMKEIEEWLENQEKNGEQVLVKTFHKNISIKELEKEFNIERITNDKTKG